MSYPVTQNGDKSCIVPCKGVNLQPETYKSRSTTRPRHPVGLYFHLLFLIKGKTAVYVSIMWVTKQMTSGKCVKTFTSSSSACGSSMPSGTHLFVSGRDSSFSTRALSPLNSNSVKWVHLPECSVPGEPDGVLGHSEGKDLELSSESLTGGFKVW